MGTFLKSFDTCLINHLTSKFNNYSKRPGVGPMSKIVRRGSHLAVAPKTLSTKRTDIRTKLQGENK